MPPQGRVGDKAQVPGDSHGCPSCAHTCVGPGVQGSPTVMTNGRASLRQQDPGVHSSCCGGNTWIAQTGSATVFINNKPAHRQTDKTTHCGGMGMLIEGSNNVIVGG